MMVSPVQDPDFDDVPNLSDDDVTAPSRDAERKRLLALRTEIPDRTRAEKDERIADHLRPLLREMLRGKSQWKIGGYWPIRNEPDLRPLFHELTKGGHRI